MAIHFTDGCVLLSREEMAKLKGFTSRVEALYEKHQRLVEEHRKLKGIHEYTILCRDAFENENFLLRRQLKADIGAQILKIKNEKAIVKSNGLNIVAV